MRRLVRHRPEAVVFTGCPQHAQAFTLRRGCQPPGQRCWLTQIPEMLDQRQPYALADVLDVVAAQPVAVADRPHHRRVSLDNFVPRGLVTVSCPGDPAGDGWGLA